jgi:hypothetical protein
MKRMVLMQLVIPGALGATQPAATVPRFPIPASPPSIEGPARRGAYIAEVGRRAALLGDETGTFEVWAWPLKLVRDLDLAFKIPEYDAPIPAAQVARRVVIRAASHTIVYSHATFTVRAHVLAPLEEPGAVILLDVETVRPLDILVRMHADFNLAWPGGFGGVNTVWLDDRRGFLLTQGGIRQYNGAIGSPAATTGTSHPAHDAPLVPSQFVIPVKPETALQGYVPIVIAGGAIPRDSLWAAYDRLLASGARYWNEKAEYYDRVRDSLLSISSPDPELDQALEWAKVNLDRQRVCNSDLGCGPVAGFGRAGAGNFRPGFGWYFGGDGSINSFAMDALGQFDLVRDGLDFFGGYQRADGKIAHEISHAAKRLPWFDQYPYTWFHGDTTPFWILACAEYWRASGDTEWIRRTWERIVRAFRWSAATDGDGDGLMENPKAGAGAIEVGGLGDDLHTDIYLAGVWVSTLERLVPLARAMGDRAVADEVEALRGKARRSLEDRFWMETAGIYAFALLGDARAGIRLNDALTVWPTTAMTFGQLNPARADRMLREVASAALTTDWGVRPLSQYHRLYEPLHYNNGAVWPFVTGFAATAQYRAHRAWAGFDLVQDVAQTTFDFARGRNPELISGAYYQPLDTAVPDQFFATSMLVTPLVRGLLGVEVDSPDCAVRLAPQIPANWDSLDVRNVRTGCGVLDFSVRRRPGWYQISVRRQGPGRPMRLTLAPALPLGTEVRAVRIDGAATLAELEATRHDLSVVAVVTLDASRTLEIEHHGGVDPIPPNQRSEIGDPVQGIRLVDWERRGDRFVLTVEGRPGRSYELGLATERPFQRVLGATQIGHRAGIATLRLDVPGDSDRYLRREIGLIP